MPYMGLRSIFTTCFFLFLIIALPSFSRVEPEALHSSEVYEIDYRGPETHSWVPPPHRSHHGLSHSTHQKSSSLRASKPMGTHTEKKG